MNTYNKPRALSPEDKDILRAQGLVKDGLRALRAEGIPLKGLINCSTKTATIEYRRYLTLKTNAAQSEAATKCFDEANALAWQVVYGRRPYLYKLANKHERENREDVVHTAMELMYKALWRWNPRRNSVAQMCQWAALRSHHESKLDVVCLPAHAANLRRTLWRWLQRGQSVEESCVRMNISPKTAETLMRSEGFIYRWDQPVGHNTDKRLSDFYADEDEWHRVDDRIDGQKLFLVMPDVVGELRDEYIQLRVLEDCTFKDLTKMGIHTHEAVRQNIRLGFYRLRELGFDTYAALRKEEE